MDHLIIKSDPDSIASGSGYPNPRNAVEKVTTGIQQIDLNDRAKQEPMENEYTFIKAQLNIVRGFYNRKNGRSLPWDAFAQFCSWVETRPDYFDKWTVENFFIAYNSYFEKIEKRNKNITRAQEQRLKDVAEFHEQFK